MTTILLIVIYLVFISLGLPDSLIGTAWPAISTSLNIDESFQGFITSAVSLCTIISSFFSVYIIRKIKTSGTLVLSISLTVLGLILFILMPNFYLLFIACVPLGLGGGAIDAALNNYVALHYKALHMNWLHSFWGVGATISPLIISYFLNNDINGWRKGGLVLAIIQFSILIISLLSIPLYKRCEIIFAKREVKEDKKEEKADISVFDTFRIRGILFALFGFLAYTAVESLTGMWFSSYVHFGLTNPDGSALVSEAEAAKWGSFFYLGITIGRFVSGLLSLKIKEKNMIRIGEAIIAIGIILLTINARISIIVLPISVVLIGLGCAPIYPGIIKDTPNRFSVKYSQNVMGIQMSFAYISNFIIAPAFGFIAKATSFSYLPYFIIAFFLLLVFGNEGINFKIKHHKGDILKLKTNKD